MTPDAHAKFLTVVHEIQVGAQESLPALNEAINEAVSGAVLLPKERAEMISIIMDVQTQLVRHLLEENESIKDKLEKFTRKLAARR